MSQTIIFVGPQGSGKGTQVELLEQAWTVDGRVMARIQTGDVFRALSTSDTFAASYLKDCLAAGKLVPDAITSGLVVERLLHTITADNTLVFDGYPRNTTQTNTLLTALAFFDRNTIDVVHLDTPDRMVSERMLERGRDDDTPDIITARLTAYHQETEPLLDHLRSLEHVRVHDVDGSVSITEVHEAVLAALAS